MTLLVPLPPETDLDLVLPPRTVPSHGVGTPLAGRLNGRRVVVVNWRDLDHTLAGGSERYAWEVARALVGAGAQVDFVTARDAGQAARDERDGITIHRGGGPFGFYAFAAAWLTRHRRGLDLVVDAECGVPAFAPLWVRRRTPVVLVMHHVHQAQFATYFPAPLARVGQWVERVAMPRVYRGRRTVAVSDSTRAEMAAQLGWTGPVDVLANGTQAPAVPVAVEEKDADRLVVLGRVVEHKRVGLALETLAALAAERPALHLDVCGAGPDLDRVRALAVDLGVTDRVTFHGYVDEATKQDLLRRAAVQLCCSDAEGWGQVVVEAAAHGVPTVARDVPGLRDSVVDGVTGVLVPDDADLAVVGRRLTAAVRTLLADLDDVHRRRRSVAACRTWADRFGWPRLHAGVVDLVCDELGLVAGPTPTARQHPHDPAPSTER